MPVKSQASRVAFSATGMRTIEVIMLAMPEHIGGPIIRRQQGGGYEPPRLHHLTW